MCGSKRSSRVSFFFDVVRAFIGWFVVVAGKRELVYVLRPKVHVALQLEEAGAALALRTVDHPEHTLRTVWHDALLWEKPIAAGNVIW